MSTLEVIGFWGAAVCYAVGSVLIFGSLALRREKWSSYSVWVASAGVAIHMVAIVGRWQAAGHFPYMDPYENTLVGTAVMASAFLGLAWWKRGFSVTGALVLPVTLITMGYSFSTYARTSPITPPYQSSWLVIHVIFAWITYASYSAVAGLAVAYILRERAAKRGTEFKLPDWVPSSDRIDDISLKLVAFGFLNNAVMIASGSIWAYRLWGAFWRWDPVETWSLLTWLAYGFYMHARLTLGWRGRRLAWLALAALIGVLMAFWGVQLAPSSYHLFKQIGAGQFMSRPQ